MRSEKKKNTKRMSLDPSKNTTFNFMQQQQKNHASELEVRRNMAQESQISLPNQEQYTSDDVNEDIIELQRIFGAIAQGKDRITVEDLYVILNEEGYSESMYSAVEMIALVDEGRKGYLTKREFMMFFSNKNYVDEEKVPPLTEELIQNREWVKAIDEHWDVMKDFQDKEYCMWVAQKVKEHQNEKKNG